MAEKGYVFYCQQDYAHIPYPCTTTGFGTIADNGCGPCCAAMVAENMLGISFKPWEACEMAIACGAREQPGTDFGIFTPVFSRAVGLHCVETKDFEEVKAFLREKRGMVIANTKGDRPEDGYIGVFSDTGHYIVLTDWEGDNTVRVLDPMYRPQDGRYDKEGRRGKVRMEGKEALADFHVIEEDCKGRPCFLFS